LSLHDLVGEHFWENNPSLGFHGATSPWVGCQGPACWMINIIFERNDDDLDDISYPPHSKHFPRRGKTSLLEARHHLGG
jgi:hypothetical protein